MKYILVVLVCLMALACNVMTADVGGDVPMVGGVPTLHMPFNAGTNWRCTQGPGGSYSHQYGSTRYDVDFDTPNAATELLSPVSGTAYVHNDSTGFGLHLNIDHGDGTYTVLAHLSQVYVSTGEWVEVGQLVALDGCTGNCTGDHVHMGVHAGQASGPAGQGQSIPFNVFALDVDAGGWPQPHRSESLVCGLSQGHFYQSQAPSWSPGASTSSSDDDDDTMADDDDATTPLSDDDDVTDPPAVDVWELCWQPAGLAGVQNAELWVFDGDWITIASQSGAVTQLCGAVEAAAGSTLTVNGTFEATGTPQSPWWVCGNWGEAGLVAHGRFYLSGIQVLGMAAPNGVDGCNVELEVF